MLWDVKQISTVNQCGQKFCWSVIHCLHFCEDQNFISSDHFMMLNCQLAAWSDKVELEFPCRELSLLGRGACSVNYDWTNLSKYSSVAIHAFLKCSSYHWNGNSHSEWEHWDAHHIASVQSVVCPVWMLHLWSYAPDKWNMVQLKNSKHFPTLILDREQVIVYI